MAESRPRKRGTLKDIAEKTGLSVSTVSRALSENPVIPERTREVVRQAARELDYRPNALAKALRTQRSNIIGVLVPDIRNPFFANLAAGIQRAANDKGYFILLNHLGDDESQLAASIEMLSSQQVDGLIVVPYAQSNQALNSIIEAGVPVITVDRETEFAVPSVTADPLPGIREALTHLAGLPHARVGFVSGPESASTARARLRAVEQVALELGIEVLVECGNYRVDEGEKAAAALLAQGVNAVLTSDLMSTIGTSEALNKAEGHLGKDFALVGFDEISFFHLFDPPIAVVDQHVECIAKEAFDQLYALIQHKPARNVVLPTSFINRASANLS